jgi:DinB superfamily
MNQNERDELIDKYAAGYDEVVKCLEGIPQDGLTAQPFPGKWSACEIVQHLADSEMNSALRLRRLLAEDSPHIQGYDQDDYAQRFSYNERDMEPALAAFRGARATSVQILKRMTAADWERAGTHNEHGRYSMELWLTLYADHAHNHAEQIRRLRAELTRAA